MRILPTKPHPIAASDFRAPTEVVIAGQNIIVRFDPRSGEFYATAKIGKWFYAYSANSREGLINELSGDIFRGGPKARKYGRKAA